MDDHPGPAIEVRNLTMRYRRQVAVDDLTFSVPRGSIFALLGPNGAGKTTTVETLEGFRSPDAGTVEVLGLDPVAEHRKLTPKIGVMLQTGGVYTAIRPPEVLRLFASYYADPADPEELLERVGLGDQRRTAYRHLSGGEQQRLSLALALIGRPEIAFLDEPTSGIDPGGRQLIRRVIADLRTEGVTVLLTTHDLDEAERLADQVAIIDHGRLLASGSPSELTSRSDTDEIRFGAATGLDRGSLGAAVGAAVTEVAPGEYRVDAPPSPTTVAAITAWLADQDLALLDLRAGRATLHDVFLRLTDGSTGDERDADGPRGDGERVGGRGRGGRRRRSTRGRTDRGNRTP